MFTTPILQKIDLPRRAVVNGLASVMTIDLSTGKMANTLKTPGTYNECEGIFADGRGTAVEGDRQVAKLAH